MAIEAKTGHQIWKSKVDYPPETPRIVCCGIINRGAAIYDGFFVPLWMRMSLRWTRRPARSCGAERSRHQGRLFDDGRPAGRRRCRPDRNIGSRVRHARFYRWLDPDTGKHLWRTYTIAAPGEPGGDTWRGDTWKHGGGSTWITGSFDPELHTVYWGVGNPDPFNASMHRRRQSLYLFGFGARSQDRDVEVALSVLAEQPVRLQPDPQMVLATVKVNGEPTKAILNANRNGFFSMCSIARTAS